MIGIKVVIKKEYKTIAELFDFDRFYMNDYEELCVTYSDGRVFEYKYDSGTMDFCVMPYTLTEK